MQANCLWAKKKFSGRTLSVVSFFKIFRVIGMSLRVGDTAAA